MPTSEIIDLIIKIALFILNVTTVAFILIMISKCIEQEYGRLKRKIDDQSKNESNNRKEES